MNNTYFLELKAALLFWAEYWNKKAESNELSGERIESARFRGCADSYRNLANHIDCFGDLSKFVQSFHNNSILEHETLL